ncbi:MAG: hypothetical protein KGL64_00655 [Acidobacteriota bacterium]|nr:hypothetical protein [Acidobacteriota bacterium]
MDLPITLRFFEQLSVYQRIRKRDQTNTAEWQWQKQFLRWAANPEFHRHRSTNIPVNHAFDNLVSMGLESARGSSDSDTRGNIKHGIFGNLVSSELAAWSDAANLDAGILVTPEGFMFGEVLNDICDEQQRYLYGFHSGLSWALFLAGAFIVFAEAVKIIYELFRFVAAHFCRTVH